MESFKNKSCYVVRCILFIFIGSLIILLFSCKKEEKEEEHIHTKIHVQPQEATCISEGHIEYWYCSKCNKVFRDRKATIEITLEETILPKTEHTIVEDALVLPTCEDTGLSLGKHCSYCNEVIEPQHVLSSLGHDYNLEEVTWIWQGFENAFLVLSCKNNLEHKKNYAATITSFVEQPTCTEPGKITYTASLSLEDKIYTNKREDILLPTDHDFDLEHIFWNWEDSHTASAQIPCKNDPKHILKYDASIDEKIYEATCETSGKIITTATISIQGKEYKDQNEEEIEALGHAYDLENILWIWDDYDQAKAILNCKKDSTHQLELTASLTASRIDPTCTADGKISHLASITLEDKTYTNLMEEKLSATGHSFDFEKGIWKWDGYEKALISFSCKNDSTHQDVYEATIHQQQVASTCASEGKITYTATAIAQNHSYEDIREKTLPIDPNQHEYDYEHLTWIWNPTPEGYDVLARVLCKCMSQSKDYENIKVESETKPSTFEEEGYIKYLAEVVIHEKTYSSLKTDILPIKEIVSSLEDLESILPKDSYDITLENDLTLTTPLNIIGSKIIFNLNGHTITANEGISISATHVLVSNGFLDYDICSTALEDMISLSSTNILFKDIHTLGGIHLTASNASFEDVCITATEGYALSLKEGAKASFTRTSLYKNEKLLKDAFISIDSVSRLSFKDGLSLYTTCLTKAFDEENIEDILITTLSIEEYLSSNLDYKYLKLDENIELVSPLLIQGKKLFMDLNQHTIDLPINFLKITANESKIIHGILRSKEEERTDGDSILELASHCKIILDSLTLIGGIKTNQAKVSLTNVFINQ